MMGRTQMLKRGILPLAAAVGLVSIAWADQPGQQTTVKASSSPAASTQASLTPSPQVMVNGQPVKLDASGQASVSSGGTKTTVQQSGGQTSINTDGSHVTTSTNGDGSVNVSVNSSTDNAGSNSYSSTNVYQNTYSSGSSSSYSSTSVNQFGF